VPDGADAEQVFDRSGTLAVRPERLTVTPGESDAAAGWMVSSKAAYPNCMYKWMNWITPPDEMR